MISIEKDDCFFNEADIVFGCIDEKYIAPHTDNCDKKFKKLNIDEFFDFIRVVV